MRDDLMTMLIAGHETTAAVCTWTLFCLMQDERVEAKVLAEVDAVIGDRVPGEWRSGTCGEGLERRAGWGGGLNGTVKRIGGRSVESSFLGRRRSSRGGG